MQNTLTYALLTEIGKVLVILTVFMTVAFFREGNEADRSPRALSSAEQHTVPNHR